MPAKTHDWEALKKLYLTGDMDLYDLSREYTGLQTSPSYQALRNKSSQDKWNDQRKAYRHMLSTVSTVVSTQPDQSAKAQEIIRNTEALIDSAEAISRHIRLAKTLQADVLELNKHVLPAIRELDLSKAKPGEIASLIRAMADVLAKSTEIERKAMGLADPTQSHKIDIDIDLSKLSDAEIEQYKMLVQKTVAHAAN